MPDTCSNTNEEQALNAALEDATPILAESLQRAEQTRRRRRRLFIGGFAMLALGASIIAAVLLAAGEPEPTPQENNQVQVAAENENLEVKAWALWWSGKNEQAAQKFIEAIKLEPESANLWHGLGWSLFNNQKHEKAADAFLEALKLEKTHPGAINGMGQVAYAKRDYQQAKEWFLQAPDGPYGNVAQQTLVSVHLLLGEYEQAEALSAKLLDGLPVGMEDGSAITGRAWVTELHAAAKAKTISDELRQKIEPVLQTISSTEEVKDPGDSGAINLLVNGGLESGTEGWIIGSNSGRMTLTPDREDKTEGEQSLRVTKTGGMPIDIVRVNVDSLTPGQKVVVSAKIKSEKVGNAWMKFFIWDADGENLVQNVDVARIHGTRGWRTVKKRFTIPEGTDRAAIQFWIILDGTMWIDDVRVEPVD